jgi:hypothetical protein
VTGPTPQQGSEMEGEVFHQESAPLIPHPPPPHPHFEMEPPSHFYPSRPRNPRDDRLVMNKHGSICPLDSEVKAVEQAVSDVEGVLKSISDDILDENCKMMGEKQGKEVARDEKHRRLKGVMRVGAFARSLMLRGECTVDLVLMCTGRPTAALFHDIARRMPAKFEELSSEVVYNVSQEVGSAAILVISQVEDHRVQVTLTLTSTEMRDKPSPEQILGTHLHSIPPFSVHNCIPHTPYHAFHTLRTSISLYLHSPYSIIIYLTPYSKLKGQRATHNVLSLLAS